MKCRDALLAFDLTVIHALGGECTVDQLRKKLHGLAHHASDKKHAWSFAHSEGGAGLGRLGCAAKGVAHDLAPARRSVRLREAGTTAALLAIYGLAIRAKALHCNRTTRWRRYARAALDDDAGLKLVEQGSVGLDVSVEQPSLNRCTIGGLRADFRWYIIRDRVDADALPDILARLSGLRPYFFSDGARGYCQGVPRQFSVRWMRV